MAITSGGPQMSAQITSTTSGGKFVRRCCVFYLFALIGFWTLSICAMHARAYSRNEPFSINTLFFRGGEDVFRDFLNFDPVTERMRKEAGYLPIYYPAPMMSGYVFFTRIFPRPLMAYLAFIVISALLGAACLMRALSDSKTDRLPLVAVVGASLVLSYPLLFVFERANMEGIVWVVLALGLTAFVARHHKTAGVLFALAASMKLYPGVLLLLLVARKRYRELAISVPGDRYLHGDRSTLAWPLDSGGGRRGESRTRPPFGDAHHGIPWHGNPIRP